MARDLDFERCAECIRSGIVSHAHATTDLLMDLRRGVAKLTTVQIAHPHGSGHDVFVRLDDVMELIDKEFAQ